MDVVFRTPSAVPLLHPIRMYFANERALVTRDFSGRLA